MSSGGAAFQSRHHPEHRQGCGHRPRHPRAVLRPGEDESPQRALPRPEQEPGSQGLPRHVCGHLRLSVGPERKEDKRDTTGRETLFRPVDSWGQTERDWNWSDRTVTAVCFSELSGRIRCPPWFDFFLLMQRILLFPFGPFIFSLFERRALKNLFINPCIEFHSELLQIHFYWFLTSFFQPVFAPVLHLERFIKSYLFLERIRFALISVWTPLDLLLESTSPLSSPAWETHTGSFFYAQWKMISGSQTLKPSDMSFRFRTDVWTNQRTAQWLRRLKHINQLLTCKYCSY